MHDMALPKAVREWLSEYKVLTDEEVHSYAATLCQNDELQTSLFALFESFPSLETLEPVYHQLYEFYRSKEDELQRFALEFIPTLIWLYLSCLSENNKKNVGGLQAFLLAVYNLEIIDNNGKPRTKTCRITTFGQPSIYHEPGSIGGLVLTESVLSRYNQTEPKIWQCGPYPQYETINGQNRQGILAFLLQLYNSDVANLSPMSHQQMCKVCSRIASAGFSNFQQLEEDEGQPLASFRINDMIGQSKRHSQVGELPPRITVSPALLVEMLSGLHFIMYNGQSNGAIKATVDIHHRASYELYADVLLVTNAIRNSLQSNAGGHSDSPMGINISLTPATSGHTISKSAITNASFRAKKLPDDISIPNKDEAGNKLQTIEEDGDISNKAVSKKDESDKPLPKPTKSGLFGRKGDKSKSKVEVNQKQNGESLDSVQVSVVKNSSRTIVDNVELQSLSRKYSSFEDHHQEDGSKGSNSLYHGKHKSSSAIGSGGGKDGKRHGHTRNSSASSVNAESYSTDL